MKAEREEYLEWAVIYQTKLHKLEMEYQRGERPVGEVQANLNADWGQIATCQKWCETQAHHDTAAATMCSKFAGVAGTLLEMKLTRQEQIRWREIGIMGAEKAGLHEDLIGHLTYLSYVYFQNNNVERAFELCDKALEVSSQQNNTMGEATSSYHKGMFLTHLNKESEAIEYLEKSSALFRTLKIPTGASNCLSTLATCYSHLDNTEKAIELYDEAVPIMEKQNNLTAVGTAYANKAVDLMKLKMFKEAEECLWEAKKIAEDSSDDSLSALVLVKLGQWHSMQEDGQIRSLAYKLFEDALLIFRKKGDKFQEHKVLSMLEKLYKEALSEKSVKLRYEQKSQALRCLMEIFRARLEFKEGFNLAEQLLRLAELKKNLPDQLEASIAMGHSSVLLKQFRDAVHWHNNALVILDKMRQSEGEKTNQKAECELYLSLGQAYRHLDEPNKAEECYRNAERIAQELVDYDALWRARGNVGLVLSDQEKHENAVKILTRVSNYYEQKQDYRLYGHAQFNLAHAFFKQGNPEEAKKHGIDAHRLLIMINDPFANEVQSQMNTWQLAQSI